MALLVILFCSFGDLLNVLRTFGTSPCDTYLAARARVD